MIPVSIYAAREARSPVPGPDSIDQYYEGRNKDRPNDEGIEHDAHRERNCICNGADSTTAGCAPARLSIFVRERGNGRLSTASHG